MIAKRHRVSFKGDDKVLEVITVLVAKLYGMWIICL